MPDKMLRMIDPKIRATMGKAGMTSEEGVAKFEARSERELQQQIESWLRLQRIEVLRPRMDKKTGIKVGWPDLSLSIHGAFVSFEVKTATGTLSPDQERQHALMRAEPNCAQVHVVRSLQEVIDIVRPMLEARNGGLVS